MAKRKSFSIKDRFDIFKRDDFKCQYCGAESPAVVLEVDHIMPISKGGSNDRHNLITACFDCNRGKGKSKLSERTKKINVEDNLDLEIESKAQVEAYEKFLKAKSAKVNRAIKSLKDYWIYLNDDKNELTRNTNSGLKYFIKNLAITELKDYMEISVYRMRTARDAYKYFCGICHSKIREKRGDN